jgi:hypothetical protein
MLELNAQLFQRLLERLEVSCHKMLNFEIIP